MCGRGLSVLGGGNLLAPEAGAAAADAGGALTVMVEASTTQGAVSYGFVRLGESR